MDRITTYSVHENFLDRLTQDIEASFLKKGKNIGNLAFVFGGKRPALFLKKKLASKIKKGFFPPRFFSIDEFIEYVVTKREACLKASELDASYSLYHLAQSQAPDILAGKETFSAFLPWAREISGFIEQLDLENISSESLRNIQAKADIGYDVPENINVLLSRIITLRGAYHDCLREKKTYSRGMMYSLAAEYIRKIDLTEFEQIFFCGFFYLHKTELALMRYLYDTQKAAFVFQGDESEWSVFEKLSQEFSHPLRPKECVQRQPEIILYSGFDVHSQVGLVREVVKSVEAGETAIVLPESSTVIPLLSEIASSVDEFNVSMGYPLNRGALYSLFDCIFKAQETKKESSYYAKDYLRVLSHPLVKNVSFLSQPPSVTRILVHKIEEALTGIEQTIFSGRLFVELGDIQNARELYDAALEAMKHMDIEVGLDELKSMVLKLHELLFIRWESVFDFHDFARSLEDFLDALLKKSFLGSYPLNLSIAKKMFSLKEEFLRSTFNKEVFPREEIFKIFKHRLDTERIAFSGSPLKGLQVLGVLETRSLNFENVIFMDVNEAVLPSLTIYEPLIPREVMISLGLNRLEKEEEIQRYQFQRLIACAKKVFLVYAERVDKEKSRFIEELIWKQQQQQGSLEALSIPQARFKVKVLPHKLQIFKDEAMIQFLKKREYSASSVNTYLACPLRFYYQYVLGLKEKEDALDEPESVRVGTFIHELLYETFSRFIGKKPVIDAAFARYFFEALDKKFQDDFAKRMKSDAFLIKQIFDFRMEQFLENERKRSIGSIICLEASFAATIMADGNAFKFKAIIDRIDLQDDGSPLILDYKTGSQDIIPESNADFIRALGSKRQALKRSIKSFQLPLYLHLVGDQQNFKGSRLNAALYFVKELKNDLGVRSLFKNAEALTRKDELMGLYLECLGALLKEIINPAVAFMADQEDARKCSSCPFFYLCR